MSAEETNTSSTAASASEPEAVEVVVDSGADEAAGADAIIADEADSAATDANNSPSDAEKGDAGAAASDDAKSQPATSADLAALSTEELKKLTYESFKKGDTEFSKLVHLEKSKREHIENHGGAGGDVIKSIVFGGLDGIITTFAIVAAVAGASLDIRVIILLGFSNLLADAVSMGLGDYLSSSAELDYQRQERKKEMWEFTNDPEGEKGEMIELYVDKLGFSEEDARKVIDIYTSKPEYAEAFVDHMCTVELEFMPPGDDENPAWDGFVTFCSFIIFGSVPMWLYVIFFVAGYDDPDSDGVRFAIACVVTALTLFLLGYVKAAITKMGSAFKSGALMMLNGSLAAASAYLVGWGLEEALDVEQC